MIEALTLLLEVVGYRRTLVERLHQFNTRRAGLGAEKKLDVLQRVRHRHVAMISLQCVELPCGCKIPHRQTDVVKRYERLSHSLSHEYHAYRILVRSYRSTCPRPTDGRLRANEHCRRLDRPLAGPFPEA